MSIQSTWSKACQVDHVSWQPVCGLPNKSDGTHRHIRNYWLVYFCHVVCPMLHPRSTKFGLFKHFSDLYVFHRRILMVAWSWPCTSTRPARSAVKCELFWTTIEIVEVNPVMRKEVKWSIYRKMPILMVNNDVVRGDRVTLHGLVLASRSHLFTAALVSDSLPVYIWLGKRTSFQG